MTNTSNALQAVLMMHAQQNVIPLLHYASNLANKFHQMETMLFKALP